jgi:hypothetical protein
MEREIFPHLQEWIKNNPEMAVVKVAMLREETESLLIKVENQTLVRESKFLN